MYMWHGIQYPPSLHTHTLTGVGGRAERDSGEEETGGAETTVLEGAGDLSEQVGTHTATVSDIECWCFIDL